MKDLFYHEFGDVTCKLRLGRFESSEERNFVYQHRSYSQCDKNM